MLPVANKAFATKRQEDSKLMANPFEGLKNVLHYAVHRSNLPTDGMSVVATPSKGLAAEEDAETHDCNQIARWAYALRLRSSRAACAQNFVTELS